MELRVVVQVFVRSPELRKDGFKAFVQRIRNGEVTEKEVLEKYKAQGPPVKFCPLFWNPEDYNFLTRLSLMSMIRRALLSNKADEEKKSFKTRAEIFHGLPLKRDYMQLQLDRMYDESELFRNPQIVCTQKPGKRSTVDLHSKKMIP